jgi:hypothetical protein
LQTSGAAPALVECRQLAGEFADVHFQRLLNFLRAAAGGGQIAQQLREEGRGGIVLRRQIRHREVQVQMHDARRVAGVQHHGGAAGTGRLRFQQLGRLPGQVAQMQLGQRSGLLRRVRALMPRVQLQSLTDDGGLFFRRPALLRRVHAGALLLPAGLARVPGGQCLQRHHPAFIQQALPEELLKVPAVHLFQQGGKARFVLQILQRVAMIEPAVQGLNGQFHAPGLVGVQNAELQLAEGGAEVVPVQAVPGQIRQRLRDGAADFGETVLIGVLHGETQPRLRGLGGQVEIHVLPQTFFQNRLFQRRLVGARQRVAQGTESILALLLLPCAGNGAHGELGAVRRVLLRRDFVKPAACAGTGRLQGHIEIRGIGGEPGEIFPVENLQHLLNGQVAVQKDPGVGGMVELFILGQKVLIGQVGNVPGIAAVVEAVAGIRKQQTYHFRLDQLVHGGQRALHLVEDHAVENRGLLGGALLKVPALLPENVGVGAQRRGENRIQIDAQQVEKVLFVAAGKRIDGLVREGHGVEERGHGAFEQIQKRFLYRVFFRAAEHRMLQNVKHAGVVGGNGLKRRAEGLVLLRPGQPQQLRAGFPVAEFIGGGVQLFARADAGDVKAEKKISLSHK